MFQVFQQSYNIQCHHDRFRRDHHDFHGLHHYFRRDYEDPAQLVIYVVSNLPALLTQQGQEKHHQQINDFWLMNISR